MRVRAALHHASLPDAGAPRKYRPASHRPRSQLCPWPCAWRWAWPSPVAWWCSSCRLWQSVRVSANCLYTQETSMVSLCSSSWGDAESVRGLLPHGLSWSDSERSAWKLGYWGDKIREKDKSGKPLIGFNYPWSISLPYSSQGKWHVCQWHRNGAGA